MLGIKSRTSNWTTVKRESDKPCAYWTDSYEFVDTFNCASDRRDHVVLFDVGTMSPIDRKSAHHTWADVDINNTNWRPDNEPHESMRRCQRFSW